MKIQLDLVCSTISLFKLNSDQALTISLISNDIVNYPNHFANFENYKTITKIVTNFSNLLKNTFSNQSLILVNKIELLTNDISFKLYCDNNTSMFFEVINDNNFRLNSNSKDLLKDISFDELGEMFKATNEIFQSINYIFNDNDIYNLFDEM